ATNGRACSVPSGPVFWRKVGEDYLMPRSARHANLETRTGRARLKVRRAPYFVKMAKGLRLGYYRGSTAGPWIRRRYLGDGSYETIALGIADEPTERRIESPGLLAGSRSGQTLGGTQPTCRCRANPPWSVQRFRRRARLSRGYRGRKAYSSSARRQVYF